MAGAQVFEGGCLCGATRYRAVGPATNHCCCHCRSCRGASGAPYVAWITVPAAGFSLTRGGLATFHSSEPVTRGFCQGCGTALTYAHRRRPAELDVTVATLDDPAAAPPEYHIWVSQQLPWVVLGDGLPRHQEWRDAESVRPRGVS